MSIIHDAVGLNKATYNKKNKFNETDNTYYYGKVQLHNVPGLVESAESGYNVAHEQSDGNFHNQVYSHAKLTTDYFNP